MMNSMANGTARPRFRSKVRLRLDRHTGQYILLYPERGLELNQTAAEIARLCTGEWTINAIEQHLARTYVDVSPHEIKREVLQFLNALAGRGLMQGLS